MVAEGYRRTAPTELWVSIRIFFVFKCLFEEVDGRDAQNEENKRDSNDWV